LAVVLIGAVGCGLVASVAPNDISRLFEDERAAARSQFTPIQVDPTSEDSAGPAFVASGDIDGDGLLDVASAWNQSNPLQMHFQRRINGAIAFETVTLVGDTPIDVVAGLAIEDLDGDGSNDIVVLVKHSGLASARCRVTGELVEGALAGAVLLYFNPGGAAESLNALLWTEVTLSQSEVAGAGPLNPDLPEVGGYTAMALGDIDGQNGPDIVVAWNPDACEGLGNRIDYFSNPGPLTARQENAWGLNPIELDLPTVKSVAVLDVDGDGDLDIVSTYPDAGTLNVRWRRNPLIDVPDAFHISDETWRRGTIGQLATGADVITGGDLDGDGITDIVARSTNGGVIVWFKGPPNPTTDPVRNVPWQVFTIAEFTERTPETLALGDIDNDGRLELVASVSSGILWFEPISQARVYDQWSERLLEDDVLPPPAVTDPNVNLDEVVVNDTVIHGLDLVDLDGDGRLDVLGTLDRRSQSGITNDAVIWYRNNGF
jgi:hypothetical protein